MKSNYVEWTWAWPWWSVLVAIAILNVIICFIVFKNSKNNTDANNTSYLKLMRTLGLVYVLVGAYRTVFVSGYLYQLAWFDSIANSSLLIRFFAFFAEVSFGAIIMLSFLKLNKEVPLPASGKSTKLIQFIESKFPYVLFCCIFIAQFFATTATITKFVTLFAIEETLWGIAFLSIIPLCFIELRKVFSFKDEKSKQELKLFRIFIVMITVFSVGYGVYSVFYHLPLEYWPYAVNQFKDGVTYPVIRTSWNAVKDAFFIVNETKDYSKWGGIGFVIWHSGYFTLCVWMVLFMMSGPRKLLKK